MWAEDGDTDRAARSPGVRRRWPGRRGSAGRCGVRSPMRRKTRLAGLVSVVTLLVLSQAGVASAAAPPDTGPATPAIVLLADQQDTVPASMASRLSVTRADQQPLVAEALGSGARNVRQFSVLNGFAATLSAGAAAKLASDPRVRAVVPDLSVRMRARPSPAASGAGRAGGAPVPGACPSDPAHPLLEPEALQLTHTAFTDPNVPQARNLATGKGVKVAYIADSVDIRNPDFLRADGSSVFIDYQDFSGEGINEPTEAREAFGDASAIAAQGRRIHDVSGFLNPAAPIPAGCTIRIQGMAPDASLVGLKAEGTGEFAATSAIVQAIDYAVSVDKVDVLNESVGTNPYPDNYTDRSSRPNHP